MTMLVKPLRQLINIASYCKLKTRSHKLFEMRTELSLLDGLHDGLHVAGSVAQPGCIIVDALSDDSVASAVPSGRPVARMFSTIT
jgi:hypothetical protein